MEATVQQNEKPNKSDKPRFDEWDLIKFALHYCIVTGHIGLVFLANSPAYWFDTWAQWLMNFGVAFEMSGFAFVSGVFGQNMSWDATSKMLCYTFGAAYLLTTVWRVFLMLTGFIHEGVYAPIPRWGYDHSFWYLTSLAWWRLLISPLFHVSAEHGLHKIFPYAVVCFLSYAGWRASPALSRALELITSSPEVFLLAPYFALGQLLPMSGWTSLLRSRWLTVIGIVFVAIWYSCLALSPPFRAWNEVANLGADCGESAMSLDPPATSMGIFVRQFCVTTRHFPHAEEHPRMALTAEVFRVDLANFVLKAAITLAMLLTLAAPLDVLKRLVPRASKIILCSGTRTIYGYVMHMILVYYVVPQQAWMDIGRHVPTTWIPVFFAAVALGIVMIFTSSLTVRLCEWMIFPYWFLRVCHRRQATAIEAKAQTTK
jgi:hypothetical protein